jgi:S-DNA-T family DNA segregation ATPase FtsK/SpoIIIE
MADPTTAGEALADTAANVVVLAPGAPEAIVSFVGRLGARVAPVVDTTGTIPPDGVVDLDAAKAELTVGDRHVAFAPDLVPQRPFEAAARRLGLCGLAQRGIGPPHRIGLGEVIAITDDALRTAWRDDARKQNAENIRAVLGCGAQGAIGIDLASDGPHFLVAGTTGSGKSELLRTLVVSAAAAHSPAHLTFLLVDFKGGSGLEPLSELPHCVGLVTDLAGTMRRTLVSLRAELRRRERLLAEARCADIDDYARKGRREPLPRLAIVVDEFRMLVDDAPESLAELLRVATIGRSLGLHLVLATQRPRGAITADIRANIGSTIALRVTSEDESRDVLGSPAAAHIPSESPGRALLAVSGREPVEFQTASLTLASASDASREVRLTPAEEWLRGTGAASSDEEPLSPAQAAQSFVSLARNAWLGDSKDLPRRPVAEPLPSAAGPALVRDDDISLGLGDYPHEQRTATVSWNPEEHGHLAAIGTNAGGAGTVLTSVAEQLATTDRERHLYLLDGDGSLGHLSSHPRVGAHVGPMDLRLAARIVERIMTETAGRAIQGIVKERSPTVILIVSAWGNWIASFRQSPQAWAEERMLDLIREGAARGVHVVISGERELTASRAFGSLPCRLFFPYGATEEAMLGWPALPPGPLTSLRAVATGALSREGPIAVQCFTPPGPDRLTASTSSHVGNAQRPFRIAPPPKLVRAAEVGQANRTRRSGRRGHRQGLAIGFHSDDSAPLVLPLRAGEILLVIGAPGTGKTSLLDALPTMNPVAGPWCHAEGGSPAPGGILADDGTERAISSGGAIVLVDNADRLTPAESQRLSAALEAGATVVATADVRPGLYTRFPLALHGGGGRTGVVLAPQSPSDGDVFGVRLEPLGQVPPGRAVAIKEGRLIEVQLGWLGEE